MTAAMTPATMVRKTFPVGPLQCNCTVLGDSSTGKGYVFDPGGDPDLIMQAVAELGLTIHALIHTHAHLDHFLASGEIRKRTGATIHLHKNDKPLWEHLETQCQMFGVPYSPVPDPDHWLSDDQDLHHCSGVCLHTPGHTPGSMSFYFAEHQLLIAGDTLFKNSIGRTDLWGGDAQQIKRSIKDRIYRLDEEAVVITGHGPETTIGHELRHNQFVRA